MPKKRINICVSPDKWQRLRQYAGRRHMSASAVIDEALDRILDSEEEKKRERQEAFEAILALDLGPIGTPEELCEELEAAHAICDDENP